MKLKLTRLLIICFVFHLNTFGSIAQTFRTPFEKNNLQSTSYTECIAFYKSLEKFSPLLKVVESGPSDVSYPIHTIVISGNKDFTPNRARQSGKVVLLYNNGIHPGEPDGIDAAMSFARDLVTDSKYNLLLKKIVLVIIPIYNVGGSLQRNSFTRANQNGPESYGFRGNRQNLDLNRDFIKCDSKNAETFTKIFHYWQPTIFLDSHTTDGADYPYAMTLISSQRQKMQKDLGQFMYEKFLPTFTKEMMDQGLETSVYVNADNDPENGIYDFLDSPRFSSGYANLFNTLSFVSESHMLKTHAVRVQAHQILMQSLANIAGSLKNELLQIKALANSNIKKMKTMPIDWEIQTDQFDSLIFKGYTQEKAKSSVTGLDRIKYNQNKPYIKKIPYYNYCKVTREVVKPDYYLVPAAYRSIIERLKWNAVIMRRLARDTVVEAVYYRIAEFKSPAVPYENHFLHSSVKLDTLHTKRVFYKGDYIISTDQIAARFLVETLEPEAPDSYFAWNFFDGILQRKEYFSSYLFEETAQQILLENPVLKLEFETKKNSDPEFAKNPAAMLAYLYNKSAWSEPDFKIYPIARSFVN